MRKTGARWALGSKNVWLGVMLLGLAGTLGSQQPQLPTVNGTAQNPGFPDATKGIHDEDPMRGSAAARQEKARNDERQKRLVADTEKLLQLATQLHDDVGKTDKNILSMDVVRRADEIEKLAHAVKERMKS